MKNFLKNRSMSFIIITFILLSLISFVILVASATNIGIKNNSITTTSSERCTENTLSISLNASNFPTITGIPTSCYNHSLQLVFVNGSTTTTFTGTIGTSSTWTSPTSFASGSTVTSILLTLNGWGIDYTWTPPSGPPFTVTYAWSQTVPKQFCVNTTISTTNNGAIDWSVTFNLNDYPYNGATSGYQLSHGYTLSGPVNNIYTITGNGNNAKVSINQSRTYTLCHYGTPNPPLPPTGSNITFTYTSTTPTPSYYVCKDITVTSHNATSFFVGWYVDVSLQDLATNYIPGGGRAIIQTGDYSMTLLNGYNYRISGIGWNTSGIKDGSPKTFSVCWGS